MDEIALAAGPILITDEQSQLLRRARKGDLEAFESVMRCHDRQVYRVARRILGNSADAQDATQEVFLRFHRALGRIDEARALGAWLYRVTVNVCTDALRARKKVVSLEETAPEGTRSSPDLRHAMEQAIAQLPDRERTALVLREIEGLSTAEVAETLGTAETTVRAQIFSARSKLRKWLGGIRA